VCICSIHPPPHNSGGHRHIVVFTRDMANGACLQRVNNGSMPVLDLPWKKGRKPIHLDARLLMTTGPFWARKHQFMYGTLAPVSSDASHRYHVAKLEWT